MIILKFSIIVEDIGFIGESIIADISFANEFSLMVEVIFKILVNSNTIVIIVVTIIVIAINIELH